MSAFCRPARSFVRGFRAVSQATDTNISPIRDDIRDEALDQEMLQREVAFVRSIDAQKIDANVVVQGGHSQLDNLLPTRFADTQVVKGYRVNLILEPTLMPLPSLSLSLDLAAMLKLDKPAFLLAAVLFQYWRRTAIAVHIDGNLAPQTTGELERYIVAAPAFPCRRPSLKNSTNKSLPLTSPNC